MPTRRSRKWLTALLVAALCFVALAVALTRVVASNRARQYLTARLEQAFGRPVEVRNFEIRWFPTPGIIANRVTISEDPRFGQEYFLRADSITASPRWRSLVAAKLQLGTLQLFHPSLNLVRNPDGRWNVESWLPPPASRSVANSSAPRSSRVAAQLSRIEIDAGRINFSRGIDRRPFALEDLSGSIEQETAGRWRIALTAHPLRATVHLQNSGTLGVTGIIAGTSARLHPADITISWNNASLADALRLSLGNDPGVRGDFGLEVNAHTEAAVSSGPARWNISASARISGLHRWDMASRPDNPAVNLLAAGEWDASSPQIIFQKLALEAPHSKIEGSATVAWSKEIAPDVHLNSSGIAFEDLLMWYRAFQPSAADGLAVDGILTGNADVGGWPVRVQNGRIDSDGAIVKLAGITLAESGPIAARFDPAVIEVLPMLWSFADLANRQAPAANSASAQTPAGTLGFQAKLFAPVAASRKKPANSAWIFDMALRGDFSHCENLLNATRLLGRPLDNGWQVEGGMTGNLRWQGNLRDRFPKATGDVSPRAMILKLPLLNQPIEIENARIELKPAEQRVTIANAAALGARWQGTIWRDVSANAPSWEFDLAADHLDAAELDRWMGPRARPNWLARLFTSGNPATPQISGPGPLSKLRAHGTLRADTFTLAPLEAQILHAEVEMLGRNVNFSAFDAKLNGGTISGGLLASLDAVPAYWLRATVKDVSIEQLAAPNTELHDRISGLLSGDLRLTLQGVGREKLLDSLTGQGSITATRVAIRGLDLAPSADASASPDFAGLFSLVNSDVSLDARKIHFQKLALLDGTSSYEGSGVSDFSRVIQFELWPRVQLPGLKRAGAHPPDRLIRVTGALEAPRVSIEPISTSNSQPVPIGVRH
jgi:uncharacterized protein involved in outer membrane biogenesis